MALGDDQCVAGGDGEAVGDGLCVIVRRDYSGMVEVTEWAGVSHVRDIVESSVMYPKLLGFQARNSTDIRYRLEPIVWDSQLPSLLR